MKRISLVKLLRKLEKNVYKHDKIVTISQDMKTIIDQCSKDKVEVIQVGGYTQNKKES